MIVMIPYRILTTSIRLPYFQQQRYACLCPSEHSKDRQRLCKLICKSPQIQRCTACRAAEAGAHIVLSSTNSVQQMDLPSPFCHVAILMKISIRNRFMKHVFSLILDVMIRQWEVFNVMSTAPTTTFGKNPFSFRSLKYFTLGLYVETDNNYKNWRSRSSAVDVATRDNVTSGIPVE
jgi:hypothetical protein